VVGWADLTAPDAVRRLEALARQPKLKGLRPMLQAIAEDGWINRPELEPAIEAMERLGLVFDALVQPRHLPHLLRFADAHPRLRIVIDHCAKPFIEKGELEPWRADMAELARTENVYCKLSGLSTECCPSQPSSATVLYIREILSIFPPQRLLWGSDWPVVNLRSDYHDWRAICADAVGDLNEGNRAQIFYSSAAAVYNLE
jgi:L-fucono-1,5-lactonase